MIMTNNNRQQEHPNMNKLFDLADHDDVTVFFNDFCDLYIEHLLAAKDCRFSFALVVQFGH